MKMVIIREIYCLILVLIIAIPLKAVTVNPNLCPTNKIAPHRRVQSWQQSQARTFGSFYDLLAPGNPRPPNAVPNDLQEQNQEDELDDCGEIEDYDENDLSSITPQGQRKHGYRRKRILFGGFPQVIFGQNNSPTAPDNRPQRPNNPPNRPMNPSTRPPYWSGGLLGTNGYRPPQHQYPSDYVKPVYESEPELHMTYRPNIVGGPLGHVIGVPPVRPTYPNSEPTSIKRPHYYPTRYQTTTQYPVYQTNRPRPRTANNDGIFKSFVDLLFK